jgi:mono/diheme cytochrome c family protein
MWTVRVESHKCQYRQFLMRSTRTLKKLAALFLGLVLSASACSLKTPVVPEGADPVLEQGRQIWGSACVVCHGATGGGGRAPALTESENRYPEIADQMQVVSDGRDGMPSFGGRFSAEEIEAVVRYIREVL